LHSSHVGNIDEKLCGAYKAYTIQCCYKCHENVLIPSKLLGRRNEKMAGYMDIKFIRPSSPVKQGK
jgi:hypothetical protein